METTIGTTTSGVEHIGLATTNLWDSVNGGLIEMMGFIQHSFVQDLETIQAVNQQWQDFSGQVANFDDTLNSQQLVQDPSTGGYYEAPYSSWDPNGPNGPGYYLPNGQELDPMPKALTGCSKQNVRGFRTKPLRQGGRCRQVPVSVG